MKSKTVAVFDLYLSTVYVYRPDLVTYAQVMRDVEIQFATAYENAKDRHLELSIEALPERDADILFIGLADENPSTNLNALAVLKQPIWSSLKAAQNQHLHVVNWAGIAGLSTAQQFIDELEKYFVDIKSV